MRKLNVFIEISGRQTPVGTIKGNTPEDAVFTYAPSYLDSGFAAPISVHLPLQAQPFGPDAAACFFEGLLPEGFSRRSVAEWLHADENDYLSLLQALGKECLGAIQVLDPQDPVPEEAAYRRIEPAEVRKLAAEGATESTKILVQSHLSLAGASGKVGLYYDDRAHTWYQPVGTAPSTHIVKQSHVRLRHLVENEQLVLRTASRMGIPTADSFILNAGTYEAADSSILLAAKRYDRDLQHSVKTIDQLPCPLRLHQEDLAQALGIPAREKYEPEGGNYLKRLFTLLRNTVENPMKDEKTLLDLLIFDALIGNTDNHVKNLSLLYSTDLHSCRLAPAYDLISTIVYRESTTEMSIAVGGKRQWNQITRETFIDSAPDMGISPKTIRQEYDRLSAAFPDALLKASEEMKKQGFRNAGALCDIILQAAYNKTAQQ